MGYYDDASVVVQPFESQLLDNTSTRICSTTMVKRLCTRSVLVIDDTDPHNIDNADTLADHPAEPAVAETKKASSSSVALPAVAETNEASSSSVALPAVAETDEASSSSVALPAVVETDGYASESQLLAFPIGDVAHVPGDCPPSRNDEGPNEHHVDTNIQACAIQAHDYLTEAQATDPNDMEMVRACVVLAKKEDAYSSFTNILSLL